jgi:hypothetical protein
MFSAGVVAKQISPTQVSVMVGWRQAGFMPYYSGYPPPSCSNLYVTDMVSSGASVRFANGAFFSTGNNTLTTKYLQGYGHDYSGTYTGKLTDLGNSAAVVLNVNVTGSGSGCGTVNFALSPSSFNVTLK